MAKFTKQAILAAFRALLDRKALDQITVKDIVEGCGINRKTFYYYYQDIYALTTDLFEQEMTRIRDDVTQPGCDPRAIQAAFIGFLRDERRMLANVYRSAGYEQLARSFRGLSRGYLTSRIREAAGDRLLRDEDIALVADMMDAALSGMIARWLEDGSRDEQLDRLRRAGDLLDGVLPRILDNCARLADEKSDKCP